MAGDGGRARAGGGRALRELPEPRLHPRSRPPQALFRRPRDPRRDPGPARRPPDRARQEKPHPPARPLHELPAQHGQPAAAPGTGAGGTARGLLRGGGRGGRLQWQGAPQLRGVRRAPVRARRVRAGLRAPGPQGLGRPRAPLRGAGPGAHPLRRCRGADPPPPQDQGDDGERGRAVLLLSARRVRRLPDAPRGRDREGRRTRAHRDHARSARARRGAHPCRRSPARGRDHAPGSGDGGLVDPAPGSLRAPLPGRRGRGRGGRVSSACATSRSCS